MIAERTVSAGKGPVMKVKERVRYGSRGQGCLIRYEGVANWYSVYSAHGKEVRQSTGSADLKAAKRFHRELLDGLAADRQGLRPFVSPLEARVTVAELVTALVADYELRGVRSLTQVRAHLRLPAKEGEPPRTILRAFASWRAAELSAEAVDTYVERRLGEGAAAATVNRETQLLGQSLRLGLRRGKLIRVPEIRRLREENARQGFFEAGEYEPVVTHLPTHLQDVVRFGYVTGWRRGEILTLSWADVDRDGGMIRLRPEHSKNRRGRALAIEGELAALMERRWQARLVPGPAGTCRVAELVFHRQGSPIVDFRKAWKRACTAAGVSGRLFHDLRRTAVRNLVRAGVPERVAMEVSGHRTRSILDRYNIVNDADLRTAMQRQSAYVRALPKTLTVARLAVAPSSGAS